MRTIIRIKRLSIALAAATVCSLSPHAVAQKIIQSFDGDKGIEFANFHPETTRCGRQPEMGVAADGKHLVQVSWQNVLVFDYTGKLLRSTPLSAFIQAANLYPNPPEGKGPYEPHVLFDEFLKRWIVAVTCRSDCFLVSATSDPMGAWGGKAIKFTKS